jgi:2-polyprenyl-3-methyl-5-hydroxy-6-metoxy-1,4-benzoquinol methylase
MCSDAKQIVASGYDEIAETYLRWTAGSSLRQHWLDAIKPTLLPNARVLDLGCGAGVPVARQLAEQGYIVVGIDGSPRQIALARVNEPRAEFIVADMTKVEFDPMSFDAVTAFYSITHVPRDEHRLLLSRIWTWLKPGGVFLASLGHDETPAWTGEWLGTTMFFSHFGAAINVELVKQAGFAISGSEIIGEVENGTEVRFLWVMARRPL